MNKYILPVQEFKEPLSPSFFEVSSEKISVNKISSILKKESKSIRVSVLMREKIVKRNKNSIIKQIMLIFTDPTFLFGPIEFVHSEKQNFLEKIKFFVDKNLPVECTLMAFPFKIPVPLKTNRITPDLGELLSLNFLYGLCSLVKKIYKPGLILNILTEDTFYPFAFISKEEANFYQEQLEKLNKMFGFDSVIKFHRLSKIIEKSENFKKVFNAIQAKNRKTAKTNRKIKEVLPSMLRIINTRSYNKNLLYSLYKKANVKDLGGLYVKISQKAISGSLSYISFLEARDKVGLIEKAFPFNIKLSYTPKAGRIGIKPGGPNMKLLSIHSIPVLRKNKNSFSTEYLFDIENDGCSYEAIYYKNDVEKKPFFYIEK